MLIQTIFSGFGGQGVLSMGQILANAAMSDGKHVTYLPAYGTEMRGGTANCTVTISDEDVASPVASDPEFVVAMNQPSFTRFQNLLQSGGFLLYNSSIVNSDSVRGDIEVMGLPVIEIAKKIGNLKVSNMVMLGGFICISNIVSVELISKTIPKVLGSKYSNLLKLNEEAIKTGYKYIKEQQNEN